MYLLSDTRLFDCLQNGFGFSLENEIGLSPTANVILGGICRDACTKCEKELKGLHGCDSKQKYCIPSSDEDDGDEGNDLSV